MHTPDAPARPKLLAPRTNLKALSNIFVLRAMFGKGVGLHLRFTTSSKVANRVVDTCLEP